MAPTSTATTMKTEVNSDLKRRPSNKVAVTFDEQDERQGPVNNQPPREVIVQKEEVTTGQPVQDKKKKKTVLEQHCAFFDVDGDGVIWPTETYRTCRSFDWSIPLSLFFAAFLHAVQSWGTVPNWLGLPDPLFRIWVDNVHFNKHGSSTMAFDNEGTYRPQILDDFFAKFDKDGKDGLTFDEGLHGVRRIRMTWDIFGQVSAMFEWGFCYILLWPEDGVVMRKDAHRVLTGDIFHEKVMQNRKQAKSNGASSK